MSPLDPREFSEVEAEGRRAWAARSLPPASGGLGAQDGPLVRQLLGSFASGDSPIQVALRAVQADVEARYLLLSGRRVVGTLRRLDGARAPVVEDLLHGLGLWTGGSEGRPWDALDRSSSVQALVERLAHRGILTLRDGPLRLCPACAAPRTPERTVYQEEVGDTYLVRFPLPGTEAPVDAVVWVDAPWRLLATSALLVNPELSYAIAEYRRDGSRARLLLSRSAMGRLSHWIAGAEFSVVRELRGRELVGRPYQYPLRHEFPEGASLEPPAGTVQAVRDVGDSGTGIVPLVPGHGGSDGQIAERLGIGGWPLLNRHGGFDLTLQHKYAGLDLASANEFVLRDLTESSSILARLRVLRGVPYCGICGHALVWVAGRAWRLDLVRLSAELPQRPAQLMDEELAMTELEETPWPVSETVSTPDDRGVVLLECGRCERLEVLGAGEVCPCGGSRHPVRRNLLPAFEGTLAAWAGRTPDANETVTRLYLSDRRRVPSLVHHLAAIAALEQPTGEVSVARVPTGHEADLPSLVRDEGADAVRAAIVRAGPREPSAEAIAERCRQERRRLARLLTLATDVRARTDRALLLALQEGVVDLGSRPELEDRAILARWARVEREAIALFESYRASEAFRRVLSFVDQDLERYLRFLRERLKETGSAPGGRAAVGTLGQLLVSIARLVAPVVPFTAEAVHRLFGAEGTSLFERELLSLDAPAVDETLVLRWDDWEVFLRTIGRFRHERRLPARAELPRAVVVVEDEAMGERLRADRPLLERLAQVRRIEIGSPRQPWSLRVRRVVPREQELARAFPSLAPEILHALRRRPAPAPGELDPTRGVSVEARGAVHPIAPEMLRLTEELPPGMVEVPFPLGELLVELPKAVDPSAAPLPALSTDALWLVRRLERRLRGADGGTRTDRDRPTAVVHAPDPLATELTALAAAIARQLGLRELRIGTGDPPNPVPNRITGRTRTGASWSVDLPDIPPPVRPVKAARRQGHALRVPAVSPSTFVRPEEVDYTDEAVIARENAIRTVADELERVLALPVLGPSKVALAWEAGLRTAERIREAPFDDLAALPGFGPSVAVAILRSSGRQPPSAPRRGPSVPRRSVPPLRVAPAGHLGRPASVLSGTAPRRDPASKRGDRRSAGPSSSRGASARAGTPSGAPPRAGAPSRTSQGRTRGARSSRRTEGAPTPVPDAGRLASTARAGVELELSSSLLGALQPFLDVTAAGHRGIAVVHESPERVRAHLGPRPAVVFALTPLGGDRALRSNDLATLGARIVGAIADEHVTAVFLEGIEHLIELHGVPAVRRLLQEVDVAARRSDARVWVHLTEGRGASTNLERLVEALLGPRTPAPSDGRAPSRTAKVS